MIQLRPVVILVPARRIDELDRVATGMSSLRRDLDARIFARQRRVVVTVGRAGLERLAASVERPLLESAGLLICSPDQVIAELERIATAARQCDDQESVPERLAHRQSMAKQ